MTIGFGILSWRGYDSLERSLQSYEDADLFSLFDECKVFLPEAQPAGIDLVERYKIPYEATSTNLGILGGFKHLAESLTSEFVLLSENDYLLIESRDEAKAQLARAVNALADGQAHVWRFRHRFHPGQTWHIHKAHAYWPPDRASVAQKMMAGLRRAIRPQKAQRIVGWAVFGNEAPEKLARDLIKKTTAGDYLISSRCLPWANNVFLIRRDFFLNTIIPAAEAAVGGRLVNGFPSLETEMNRGYWRNGNFTTGVSTGLFTHERMNDRGY